MDKITVKELHDKFPKALKSFRDFIIPAMSYAGEGEPPVELTPEIEEQVIEVVLTHTPRNLYDFFDSKKLYISIINDGEENMWRSDISGSYYTEDSSSRPEAEQKAFYEAFKILNNG